MGIRDLLPVVSCVDEFDALQALAELSASMLPATLMESGELQLFCPNVPETCILNTRFFHCVCRLG